MEETANKQREYIPDIQNRINECHSYAYAIDRLVTMLHHSMNFQADTIAQPEDPKPRPPAQIEGLLDDAELLVGHLREITEALRANIYLLLGETD